MTKKLPSLFLFASCASLIALGAVNQEKLDEAKSQLKRIREAKEEIAFALPGEIEVSRYDSATNKISSRKWRIAPSPNRESGKPFTFLPGIPAIASTWNVKLADFYGHVVGEECRAANIDAVLAPWLNFSSYDPKAEDAQSFGEDPTLTARLTVNLIKAIQDHDVAVCAGNFCLEDGGRKIDSRTLHEVYLPVFRSALKDALAQGLLCSKEPYDEIPCCDNQYLIRGIVRGNWGFTGPVLIGEFDDHSYMSEIDIVLDEDKEKCSIAAGSGDLCVLRLLYMLANVKAIGNGSRDKGAVTNDWHTSISRKVAEESIVLLKNEKSILPVDVAKTKKIAILELSSAGNDCHHVKLSSGLKEYFKAIGKTEIIDGYKLEEKSSIAEIIRANPDIVFLFLPSSEEFENKESQIAANINSLIDSLKNHIIAIESTSFGLKMPRLNDFPVLIHVPSPGEESPRALARIVSGEINPSGRLNFTWAKESILNKPFIKISDGRYIGYRWYDKFSSEPLFPFGHGLGYTSFRYEVDFAEVVKLAEDKGWSVSFPVRNVGGRKGMEVVQFYSSYLNSKVERYEKELKGFAKTKMLEPGESEMLTVVISPRDLAYWDVFQNRFRLDAGEYALLVGSSAGDIRGKAKISVSKDYVFED